MKKIVITVLVAVAVIVEAIVVITGMSKDSTAPEIHIYQENIAYGIGCDDEVILNGIVASDRKDGNVSDSVEIVSRATIVEGKIEAVTLSACDKSGNVATTKVVFVVEDDGTYKILDYSKYKVDMEKLQYTVEGSNVSGVLEGYEVIGTEEPDTEEPSTEEPSTEEPSSEEPSSEEPSSEEPSSEEPSSEEPSSEEPSSEEPSSETPTVGTDGKPVIVLKYTEVTVEAGASNTVYVNAVREILDDKDANDYLFRRIGMTENIDLSVAGDYEQGLYVTDSDGNRSDIVKLIIHVR